MKSFIKAVKTIFIIVLLVVVAYIGYGMYKILRFIDNDEKKYIMYTPNKLK